MPHALQIFPRARADIRAAGPGGASDPLRPPQGIAGLLAAIRSLANNPERCPLADEAADLGCELRELHYGKRQNLYRILFTCDAQTVNVLRVRHAAQDRLALGDV